MAKAHRDHRQINLWLPESTWTPPPAIPHIPDGEVVAIDTETRDNGLAARKGPGWFHRDGGHLCGVSFAWAGGSDYLPTRHPDTECFDHDTVIRWLEDLERRCTLVFQNATYDLGWTGLRPTKRVYDTHAAAVLIDENRMSYSLDSLADLAGVPKKDEVLLKEAAAALGVDPKGELWKLPAKYVGPYATQDAVSTLGVHNWQTAKIEGQKLHRAYELECDLIPIIRDMRQRGIRIDVSRAEQLVVRYRKLLAETLLELKQHTSTDMQRAVTIEDCRSPSWLKWQFDAAGIEYPRTEAGNASFEKEWLVRQSTPLAALIVKARGLAEAAEKFVSNYILDYLHMGRLHAEINQLRDASEEFGSKGTRSYRFSYSNPPLQQMPRPEPDRANPEHKDYKPGFVDIGTEIRGCFLPEEGELAGAPDYSQQEYRWIVIKAAALGLTKADTAVKKYQEDPSTDFHNYVRDMTGLVRKRAKDCNFAKAFGAGIPKFALMTGMPLEEARSVMEKYDTELPFVKEFGDRAQAKAQDTGYVLLIDGYRARFDKWEAGWIDKSEWERARSEGQDTTPCDREEAVRRSLDENHVWYKKRLRRADARVAGNRAIQGSAAIQTKRAMRAQAREGYLPMLQMHDELLHSVSNPVYARRICEIMRDVVQTSVPFKVDAEFGDSWGTCKLPYDEAVAKYLSSRT